MKGWGHHLIPEESTVLPELRYFCLLRRARSKGQYFKLCFLVICPDICYFHMHALHFQVSNSPVWSFSHGLAQPGMLCEELESFPGLCPRPPANASCLPNGMRHGHATSSHPFLWDETCMCGPEGHWEDSQVAQLRTRAATGPTRYTQSRLCVFETPGTLAGAIEQQQAAPFL